MNPAARPNCTAADSPASADQPTLGPAELTAGAAESVAPADHAAGAGRAALPAPRASRQAGRAGVLYGVAAYGLWGVFPVYFKAVKQVPALEVLAHRILWAAVFLVLLMLLRRNLRSAFAALRCHRTLLVLTTTTMLIAGNWLVFIWAVTHDRLMQASLGYFINPLLSVLLGFVVLGERLRRWQTVSVIIAAAGVTYLTVTRGHPPGVALFLAGSFALYGLLRKVAPVEAMAGLTVETALLAPAALAYLAYQMWQGGAAFGSGSLQMDGLLLLAGVITATPLLWFTEAARRLRLTTIGFLQFIAPTGHFLLALAYGEPFTPAYVVTFGCIWTALAIYSIDAAGRPRLPDRTPHASEGPP